MNQNSNRKIKRLQLVSIPDLNAFELENEDKLLAHPHFNRENISSCICEYYYQNQDVVRLLFNFFEIEKEEISDNIWRLKSSNNNCLTKEYLDAHYLEWIKNSNQENTMDEFGQLLEFQAILQKNSENGIYAILR